MVAPATTRTLVLGSELVPARRLTPDDPGQVGMVPPIVSPVRSTHELGRFGATVRGEPREAWRADAPSGIGVLASPGPGRLAVVVSPRAARFHGEDRRGGIAAPAAGTAGPRRYPRRRAVLTPEPTPLP